MKTILISFILAFSTSLFAHEIRISKTMTDNASLPFIERDSALALNVHYDDVKTIRKFLSKYLKKDLKFLRSWEKDGEAHVTTITPPEFQNHLRKFITLETINSIARKNKIQESDIEILGIGSGKKNFGVETGETFFVIVMSKNLLKIRKDIYKEYIRAGGNPAGFRLESFYPHITLGFTHEDIHENDGLLKDVEHSLDKRFQLILE